ncbi:MAG: LysR family transcriptional regulator [Pseudomonadota bacterium]
MHKLSTNLPPLTWLRAFEAAARHLSFTRAAGELNLTQSAVSQHVRSLEAFLGAELFIRKTRAMELTEAGSNYLPVVREAFDLIATGTQAFTGVDRGQTMVLNCNMAFSAFWLAPRLHRLYARHPWLVLNLVTPIWDPDKHTGRASMDIRFGRPEDMSPDARQLSRDRFYPVCSPAFAEVGIDLGTSPLFDCAGVTGSWDAWFKSGGGAGHAGRAVNLGSTYVIAFMAARGSAGLAMGHDTLVSDLIEKGEFIRPFDHAPLLSESYFLTPPPSHAQTPASRALEDWLNEELA